MAPANAAEQKPKRKRQRKRKALSSSEQESSSSSSDDSSSEDEAPAPIQKLPTPVPSSADSDSSSSDSSSEEESEAGYRGRRRGKKVAAKAAALAEQQTTNNNGTSAQAAAAGGAAPHSRGYPARSPSPELQPNNIPLGQAIFPALKARAEGPILMGQVPGDEGFEAEEGGESSAGVAGAAVESEFGVWWRARLVHEFEKDLAPLAAEPGLTAPRLELLLSSLTSLSHLHTTSSTAAKQARSIWHHDPSTAIDPLAVLEVDEMGEEWGKRAIGGEGDVEVGAEGVKLDEERKARKAKEDGMEVDE